MRAKLPSPRCDCDLHTDTMPASRKAVDSVKPAVRAYDGDVCMRITVVFEFPEGKDPEIVMSEHWKGGRLIVYTQSDALAELDRLRAAARHYCCEYLRDEARGLAADALWAAVVGS